MDYDLFTLDYPEKHSPVESNNSNKQVFLRKWRMLEYLEGLRNEAALVYYEDKGVSYRVPIMIGDTHFASNAISSRPTNVIIPSLLKSKHSKLEFKTNDERLSAIELIEGTYYFLYKKEVDKISQEFKSKVKLKTKPYSMLKRNFKNYDESLGLEQLIGVTLSAELRCDHDLVRSIETIPFKVVSVSVEGEVLTIIGTNDVLIKTTGFKGSVIIPI